MTTDTAQQADRARIQRADAIQKRAKNRALKFERQAAAGEVLRSAFLVWVQLRFVTAERGDVPLMPPTPGRARYIADRITPRVLAALDGGPLSPDAIRDLTHITMSALSDALPRLLVGGEVRRLPDGRYEARRIAL